jgi:tellurite resistance protein TerC
MRLRGGCNPGFLLRPPGMNALLGAQRSERCQMKTLRHIKRVAVAVIGFTVLLMGVALIVLPGPAFLVIPAGLAILATEFAWAREAVKRAKGFAERVNGRRKAPKQQPL